MVGWLLLVVVVSWVGGFIVFLLLFVCVYFLNESGCVGRKEILEVLEDKLQREDIRRLRGRTRRKWQIFSGNAQY